MGHGLPSLRFAVRPYSLIDRSIAIGGFLHIEPSILVPTSWPITHAIMAPVSTINLFVGFSKAHTI
jgi:hypothetical protein